MRADARRNRELLVSVAGEVVAEQGADASLEEIARRAGVGSATLHRHFPSRHELLDAVFGDRVAALCASADALLTSPDAGAALVTWLRAMVRHAAANRGLASSLLKGTGASCHAMILSAGGRLVARAQESGELREDVTIAELLKLVNGIALATEETPQQADHLLTLTVEGLTR